MEEEVQVVNWIYEYAIKNNLHMISSCIEKKYGALGLKPSFPNILPICLRTMQLIQILDISNLSIHQWKSLSFLLQDLLRLPQFQMYLKIYGALIDLYYKILLILFHKKAYDDMTMYKHLKRFDWEDMKKDFCLKDSKFALKFKEAYDSARSSGKMNEWNSVGRFRVDDQMEALLEVYVGRKILKLMRFLKRVFPSTALEKILCNKDIQDSLLRQDVQAYKIFIRSIITRVTEDNLKRVLRSLLSKNTDERSNYTRKQFKSRGKRSKDSDNQSIESDKQSKETDKQSKNLDNQSKDSDNVNNKPRPNQDSEKNTEMVLPGILVIKKRVWSLKQANFQAVNHRNMNSERIENCSKTKQGNESHIESKKRINNTKEDETRNESKNIIHENERADETSVKSKNRIQENERADEMRIKSKNRIQENVQVEEMCTVSKNGTIPNNGNACSSGFILVINGDEKVMKLPKYSLQRVTKSVNETTNNPPEMSKISLADRLSNDQSHNNLSKKSSNSLANRLLNYKSQNNQSDSENDSTVSDTKDSGDKIEELDKVIAELEIALRQMNKRRDRLKRKYRNQPGQNEGPPSKRFHTDSLTQKEEPQSKYIHTHSSSDDLSQLPNEESLSKRLETQNEEAYSKSLNTRNEDPSSKRSYTRNKRLSTHFSTRSEEPPPKRLHAISNSRNNCNNLSGNRNKTEKSTMAGNTLSEICSGNLGTGKRQSKSHSEVSDENICISDSPGLPCHQVEVARETEQMSVKKSKLSLARSINKNQNQEVEQIERYSETIDLDHSSQINSDSSGSSSNKDRDDKDENQGKERLKECCDTTDKDQGAQINSDSSDFQLKSAKAAESNKEKELSRKYCEDQSISSISTSVLVCTGSSDSETKLNNRKLPVDDPLSDSVANGYRKQRIDDTLSHTETDTQYISFLSDTSLGALTGLESCHGSNEAAKNALQIDEVDIVTNAQPSDIVTSAQLSNIVTNTQPFDIITNTQPFVIQGETSVVKQTLLVNEPMRAVASKNSSSSFSETSLVAFTSSVNESNKVKNKQTMQINQPNAGISSSSSGLSVTNENSSSSSSGSSVVALTGIMDDNSKLTCKQTMNIQVNKHTSHVDNSSSSSSRSSTTALTGCSEDVKLNPRKCVRLQRGDHIKSNQIVLKELSVRLSKCDVGKLRQNHSDIEKKDFDRINQLQSDEEGSIVRVRDDHSSSSGSSMIVLTGCSNFNRRRQIRSEGGDKVKVGENSSSSSSCSSMTAFMGSGDFKSDFHLKRQLRSDRSKIAGLMAKNNYSSSSSSSTSTTALTGCNEDIGSPDQRRNIRSNRFCEELREHTDSSSSLINVRLTARTGSSDCDKMLLKQREECSNEKEDYSDSDTTYHSAVESQDSPRALRR